MSYKCYFHMDVPELKEKGGEIDTEDELPFVPYPGLWLHFYGNRAEAAFRVSEVTWHMHELYFAVMLDAIKPMAMLHHPGVFQAAKKYPNGVAPEHIGFWLDFLKAGGWDVEMPE